MKRLTLLSFAFFLASCSCIVPYHESAPLKTNQDLIMVAISRAVTQRGFIERGGMLQEEVRGKERHFISDWKVSLEAMRSLGTLNQGIRRKVEGYIELREGKYIVKIAVRKEVNQDVDHPLDPTFADWKKVEYDDLEAKVLLRKIQYIFKD